MTRPQSSGWISIGVSLALAALLFMPRFGAPAGNISALKGTSHLEVHLLTMRKPTLTHGVGKSTHQKLCTCHYEFQFEGETRIYQLETTDDGQIDCQVVSHVTQDWNRVLIYSDCSKENASCTTFIKGVDGVAGASLPHEGWGSWRLHCETK